MIPSNQKELYGLEKYFTEIINLYNLDKLPNKILLSGKKGNGKSTLAYHFINYVFSFNEENKYDLKNHIINKKNISFNLLKNNTHPNFYLIDLMVEKKNIEIDQIRKMINYANKSSFNNKPRFILIDNIENLNLYSANALLKIIEEPNQNIYFILIHNNSRNIMATLKSRCLTFKINLSFKETIDISNLLVGNNIFDLLNKDLINYYNSPGDFISLINFFNDKNINLKEFTLISLLNHIIDNKYYRKNLFIKHLIINFIELYFLKTYKLSSSKDILINIYNSFIRKIYNTQKFNLDEESLFIEFKSKLMNG